MAGGVLVIGTAAFFGFMGFWDECSGAMLLGYDERFYCKESIVYPLAHKHCCNDGGCFSRNQ